MTTRAAQAAAARVKSVANLSDDEVSLVDSSNNSCVGVAARKRGRFKKNVVTLEDSSSDDDDVTFIRETRSKKRNRQTDRPKSLSAKKENTNGVYQQEEEEEEDVVVLDSKPRPPKRARSTTPSTNRKRSAVNEDPDPVVMNVARKPTRSAALLKSENSVHPSDEDDDDDDDDDNDDDDDDDLPQVIINPNNLKKGDSTVDLVHDVEFVGQRRPKTIRGRRLARKQFKQQQQQQELQHLPLQQQQQPWLRVLEVFPDARVAHVQSLLQLHSNDVTVVLCILGEQGYPKEEIARKSPPDASTIKIERPETAKPQANTKTIDFHSTSSFKPSNVYKSEVVACLVTAFPFLTTSGARSHLRTCDWHYAVCHDKIRKALVGSVSGGGNSNSKKESNEDKEKAEESQYKCLKLALAGNDLDARQRSRLQIRCVSVIRQSYATAPIKSNGLTITDPTLRDEVTFVDNEMKDWMNRIESRITLRQLREACKKNGTAVSCNCCFDEFALEEMLACREEGHLFCSDCVSSYAENQIFGAGNFGTNRQTKKPAMELMCMHGDGCSSGFQLAQLRKALSEKVMAKYDELQFQLLANIMDDMCSCPKCGFQAALAKSEMIFRCPVSDCLHESCRKCGEPPHIPLRCEEVEKQVETNGRVTVEEAISKAKIRTCPKCSKSFIKSDGCNKITCACGILVCYICRQKIDGYQHFCQIPHCTHENCNKCKLHSNVEEDDKRAMREAGLLAAEQVRKESILQQPGVAKAASSAAAASATVVQVDVEQLLRDPATTKPAAKKTR